MAAIPGFFPPAAFTIVIGWCLSSWVMWWFFLVSWVWLVCQKGCHYGLALSYLIVNKWSTPTQPHCSTCSFPIRDLCLSLSQSCYLPSPQTSVWSCWPWGMMTVSLKVAEGVVESTAFPVLSSSKVFCFSNLGRQRKRTFLMPLCAGLQQRASWLCQPPTGSQYSWRLASAWLCWWWPSLGWYLLLFCP